MEAGIDYSRQEHLSKASSAPYREGCGHILWPAMVLCPDVLFAAVHLAQFVKNPSESHWKALKHVMKYLYTTCGRVLVLGGGTLTLSGYCDSDWASQEHRHSISSYTFFLGDGCIMWSTKKQGIIALSSAEAEYIAAMHAVKEAVWLCNILTDFGIIFGKATELYCNNQLAIAIAHDGKFHA